MSGVRSWWDEIYVELPDGDGGVNDCAMLCDVR